jgi:hypothetical protein
MSALYLHINARGVKHNDGQDVAHQPQGGDHRDGHPLHHKFHASQAVLLSLPLGVVHAVQQLKRIVLQRGRMYGTLVPAVRGSYE